MKTSLRIAAVGALIATGDCASPITG